MAPTRLDGPSGCPARRGGLGHPVPLDEHSSRDGLPELCGRRCERHRPGDRESDGGQIDVVLRGGASELLVDRRHRREEGGGASSLCVEQHVHVEPWEEHERRTDAHREGQAQREAVGVEERKGGVDDLLAVDEAGHPRPALRGVRPEVAVGEERALRPTGGASGVLQHGGVRAARSGEVVGHCRCARDQSVPPPGPGRRGGHRLPRLLRLREGKAQRESRSPA